MQFILVPGAKLPGCETDHSLASSTEGGWSFVDLYLHSPNTSCGT